MVAKLKCIAHNDSVLEWKHEYDPSYYRNHAEYALNRAHFLRWTWRFKSRCSWRARLTSSKRSSSSIWWTQCLTRCWYARTSPKQIRRLNLSTTTSRWGNFLAPVLSHKPKQSTSENRRKTLLLLSLSGSLLLRKEFSRAEASSQISQSMMHKCTLALIFSYKRKLIPP